MASPSSLLSILRFGGISGVTWLIDFGLLFVLTERFRIPVLYSNLLSASTAAIIAFLTAHYVLFRGTQHRLLLRTCLYLAYTVVVIVFMSWIISRLEVSFYSVAARSNLSISHASCALVAKLIATPFNFLLNFQVARFTSGSFSDKTL